MSKQEQLAEYITQDIIGYIMEAENVDLATAMHRFYTSATYEKLTDFDTVLYRESSAYVYSIYMDEQKNGKLINA